MNLFFGSAREPFAREFTLWITEARRRVGVIAAGLRGVARVKGVSVNVEAQSFRETGSLTADTAVA